jgi:single-strand DNA-binding protein
MNKALLTGRLTKDPEAFTTQSGVSRSTFDIAVQREYKNPDGKYGVDFLTVVAWRQTADFCNKYLTKGRMVAVEGRIDKRSYDAKDGTKRYVTEIIANHVEGLGSPNSDPGPTPPPSHEDDAPEDYTEVDDDELPFD